ncbi:amino acid permease [Ligilactobacillus apodemi]|uniref:Amino acid permease n=1 Tax=Ligilactobacillus apodemi DSM 16634 = JCM 16172 TaxID=1423724 RepID=A0A0R1TZG3_9LACO|nr:amino acid permease [Ligilactobacillus apodemi]KRL84291.1 amino acid permease [Ligilactobacillus apodemi DSM 16634 = JCM 16172]
MKNELSRALTHRHVQMIAIGGAIGTGLFLGSGSAIQKAGPAIIFAYLIAGIFCFLMMRAIGELILSDTSKSSFIEFVREYLGEKWEFVVGWTYWLCWESLAMADLTASGIYIRYWFPNIPQWVTALVIILILLAFNLLSVGVFGELESWFSSIKVMAIIALIVTGFILLATSANVGGNQVQLSNLVNYGGLFPKGFSGLMAAFPMVIFAFTGIEMVGLTSGETAEPQKDLPRAINTLPLRIGLFYIGSMFVLMCIYPWNEISTSSSPFVQVFSGIGINFAAAVINFVVLTAALSACNSAIFSTSRTLFVLSSSGQAPKRMAKISNRSVPVSSLVFSSSVLFVIVVLNYILPSSIFEIISGVATVSFIFVWIILVWCHYKYREQNPTKKSVFPMPLYPVSNFVTIFFFIAVLGLLTLSESTLLSIIFALLWFMCLFIASRTVIKKAE